MLSVGIFINGRMIYRRDAVRIKGKEHEVCTYRTEDATIEHHYDDGAEVLAMKLLQLTMKERNLR